ncbi:MAG: sulfatase-like hydrolase/transferase [Candidatus Eremiobacteraeota bacterium]|nr:sulfatase-like hydrolase/transferase [Candidatus Eremiobacteraeota bacterium]MCW5867785.1 sulfatase-like hydrolase/transferase [Candidatus Eremiobacteraeota bacterium]
MATRRDFLKTSAGAVVAGTIASGCGSDSFVQSGPSGFPQPLLPDGRRPNILLLLVDEMRLPPEGFAANEGEIPDLKEIFGFSNTLSTDNQLTGLLPGLIRLRQNSVVLRKHYIAAAACSPSRTTFLTGQYPSLHGVTQVTGTFSAAHEVQYLDPAKVPTAGDWFRAAGYTTHYMGKWHVSNTSFESGVDSLEPWGFANYRPSWPEPNSTTDNLGTYRDPGFADDIAAFLREKGATRGTGEPWFAVASFVNPHDTGAYPIPFFGPNNPEDPANPTTGESLFLSGKLTPGIPQQPPALNDMSWPNVRNVVVNLNPGGFPQQTFNLPPTYNEDLSTKPSCQYEASIKMQLALAAPLSPALQIALTPYPLQTLPTENLRQGWAKTSGSFYAYLQYLVDLELTQILQTFDQAGLGEDTIIVFTSDHGTLAMSHGLSLQKFFNAYEESLRVPFVISSPLVNPTNQMREYKQTTSHVDLLPTLLGLAGFSDAEIGQLKNRITGHSLTRDLVGLNLVPRILSGADLAQERPGVLFTTSDDPTRLPPAVNPATAFYKDNYNNNYIPRVNQIAGELALLSDPKKTLQTSPPNTIEPNSIHAICTGDWKYARYFDEDNETPKPDQYEFYHLPSDPIEAINLVDFQTGTLRNGVAVPGLSTQQLQDQLDLLKTQLARQEAAVLLTP